MTDLCRGLSSSFYLLRRLNARLIPDSMWFTISSRPDPWAGRIFICHHMLWILSERAPCLGYLNFEIQCLCLWFYFACSTECLLVKYVFLSHWGTIDAYNLYLFWLMYLVTMPEFVPRGLSFFIFAFLTSSWLAGIIFFYHHELCNRQRYCKWKTLVFFCELYYCTCFSHKNSTVICLCGGELCWLVFSEWSGNVGDLKSASSLADSNTSWTIKTLCSFHARPSLRYTYVFQDVETAYV